MAKKKRTAKVETRPVVPEEMHFAWKEVKSPPVRMALPLAVAKATRKLSRGVSADVRREVLVGVYEAGRSDGKNERPDMQFHAEASPQPQPPRYSLDDCARAIDSVVTSNSQLAAALARLVDRGAR